MPLPKGRTNNPNGRPVGSKNERSAQWDALAESITSVHAKRFNEIMSEMLNSRDPEEREKGAELFLKTVEYFKPKQARVTHTGDQEAPVIIQVMPNI